MDDEQKIRNLQMQVVSMRTELSKTYSKLLKQEYQYFTDRLKNGESIIPEKLENFQLMDQSELERIYENVMEVQPAIKSLITVDEILRKSSALRRARQILKDER